MKQYLICNIFGVAISCHQTKAFKMAEEDLLNAVMEDKVILLQAQQRAKILLEEYVKNISNSIGVEYEIQWEYLENESEVE